MTEHTPTQQQAAGRSAARWQLPRLTSRPETFGEHLLNSSAVWLGLMAYWALTDVLIAVFPPGGRQIPPDGALAHLRVTLAGLAAIWCMHRTGFPAAWDARIPVTRRLLLPILVGVVSSAVPIGLDLVVGLLATVEALTGQAVNVAFPGSLLVYSAAAIHQVLRFVLFPLPVLLWLISSVLLRGRGRAPTFWVLAVLVSAVEPSLQSMAVVSLFGPAVVATIFVGGFAANFASAVFLRRYGLVAAILVRLGNYVVWHILYGNFFV
jgi:hypothetical protein